MINPVADRFKGLVNRQFLNLLAVAIRNIHQDGLDTVDRSIGKFPQISEVIIKKGFNFLDIFFFFDLNRYFDALDPIDGDIADALLFELLPYFLGNALNSALQGFFRIYFQNQVHTTLKIKP